MKILLILSLIANVILGVLYFQEKSQPPIERIIMEEKPVKILHQEVLAPEVVESKKPKTKKRSEDELHPNLSADGEMMAQDYEEAVEHIESAKAEYLTNQLGIPEEILKKEGKLRAEYMRKSNKVYSQSPIGEVTIADRRKILDLEEELQRKVEGLYGKENWQKFQNYQKKYNERIIKRVKEENAPAILMGP